MRGAGDLVEGRWQLECHRTIVNHYDSLSDDAWAMFVSQPKNTFFLS
jgi:hypothetical protein